MQMLDPMPPNNQCSSIKSDSETIQHYYCENKNQITKIVESSVSLLSNAISSSKHDSYRANIRLRGLIHTIFPAAIRKLGATGDNRAETRDYRVKSPDNR